MYSYIVDCGRWKVLTARVPWEQFVHFQIRLDERLTLLSESQRPTRRLMNDVRDQNNKRFHH
jgi:hypothetical protein